MKENNIEKDIIKKFEKFCENLYVFKDDDMGGHFEKIVGNQRANTTLGYLVFKENLEEKLSDYKRVLKENEELKSNNEKYIIHLTDEQYRTVIDLAQNDINKQWIQKIKDKIEELEEELEIMKVDNMYGRYKEYGGKTKWERLFATKYGMHDALQELLEGRK